jgi:hypothetical protein
VSVLALQARLVTASRHQRLSLQPALNTWLLLGVVAVGLGQTMALERAALVGY